MIAPHKIQWNMQLFDDKFLVIIREISTGNHKINPANLFADFIAVNEGNYRIADRENVHTNGLYKETLHLDKGLESGVHGIERGSSNLIQVSIRRRDTPSTNRKESTVFNINRIYLLLVYLLYG